ncbi:MAG: TonB-dependent receptor [Syntrophorhabdaceae bacterium]|nr:TonB-dependent receptor [Syntrophorhabdaceae bacterium]
MSNRIFLSACITFMLMAIYCFAAEPVYRLDDIVITASRVESTVKESGMSVTLIKKEDIEEMGAQTLSEVFVKEPGLLNFNILGNPQSAKIDIRGYGEAAPQNALVLIDGRRVNNIDLTGADLSQIPVDAIERIEVYRGPASVLYGDNATGGVVNIIMKKGEGKPKLLIGSTGGSYNYIKNKISLNGSQKGFSYYILTSNTDTDGYRHNNDFNSKDIFGNISIDPLKKMGFTIKFGHHRDNYGLPGSLLRRGELAGGIWDRKDSKEPNNNGSTEDNFVDVEGRFLLTDYLTLTLSGSVRNKHNATHYEGAGWFSDSKGHLKTLSFTPQVILTSPILKKKNTLTVGVDYYRYPSVTDFYGGAWVANTGNVWKTDLGYYINDKFSLTKDLLLEAGYRYQVSRYEFDYTDQVFTANSYQGRKTDRKDAFRFSVNYAFTDKGSVYASYSKGFRFPVADEFIGIDPTTFAPFFNPNIAPQTVEEYGAGIRWNPLKWLGGMVSLFQSTTHNEIYFNPKYKQVFGIWLGANENYDRTKRFGVETKVFLNLSERFSIDLFYSYIEAKFDGGVFDGNTIPFVPKNKFGGSAAYRYIFNNHQFNLSLTASGVDNRYVISDQENSQRKMPGYFLLDTSVVYKFKDSFTAVFAIKNILDKDYYEYAAYSPNRNDVGMYPAPGRTFSLGLQYQF